MLLGESGLVPEKYINAQNMNNYADLFSVFLKSKCTNKYLIHILPVKFFQIQSNLVKVLNYGDAWSGYPILLINGLRLSIISVRLLCHAVLWPELPCHCLCGWWKQMQWHRCASGVTCQFSNPQCGVYVRQASLNLGCLKNSCCIASACLFLPAAVDVSRDQTVVFPLLCTRTPILE